MKKVLFATMLMASISGLANAQTAENTQTEATAQPSETPVKPADLPEAVKSTLSGEAYKDWTVAAASLVKTADKEYYKIELTKGEEKNTITLGTDGKPVN